MAAALPFCLGLAAVAGPLVLAVLGPKWTAAAPLVRLLALAMPFMTLQVLLTPACTARGRPGVGVRNGAVGAGILIAAFLVGVDHGPVGLACAWLAAYPLYLAVSLAHSLPVIGARIGALAASIAPPAIAAVAMALVVAVAGAMLPVDSPVARLAILVPLGAVAYAGLLWLIARSMMADLIALVRRPA